VIQASSPSSPIRVLIADSNSLRAQLLSIALRRRSDFHVSRCMQEIASILPALTQPRPHVVLISLNHTQDVAGQIATVHHLHLSCPTLAIILLVESYDREMVVEAFRSGVKGMFCIADAQFRLLCRCIQKVAAGQIWVNNEQLTYLMELISDVPSLRVFNSRGQQLLTPREEQVVGLVAQGLSNRAIAGELKLSEHTVKKYLFRVFDKLGISSRVELVLYAVNNGDRQLAHPMQA
jgi:DNA-binding NarL/FixJ family response regulator